jgi:hypothetical protein
MDGYFRAVKLQISNHLMRVRMPHAKVVKFKEAFEVSVGFDLLLTAHMF